MVKSHGQTAGLFTIIVNSKSFDPFAWKLPNLAQWFPLESRCVPLIFRGQKDKVLNMSAQYLKPLLLDTQ